jgi:hypothetical protein
MVICGGYMHETIVSNDMENINNDEKKGGRKEGGGAFMSNNKYKKIEN